MSDAHWRLLAPLLPAPAPTGRPRTHELRAIINAILYIVRNGCTWRALPHDLPPWPTVHYYFRKWRHDGTLERVLDELRSRERVRQGRDPMPSGVVIDSQSVKTTEKGDPGARTGRSA